jgi:hypothetical protein
MKQTSKVLPFNQKNARLFANSLYQEKNGLVICKMLCDETLKNKEKLHCALGEAYTWFINSVLNVSELEKQARKINNQKPNCKDDSDDEYYMPQISVSITDIVINKLVSVSGLLSIIKQEQLKENLDELTNVNDIASSYSERSESVQEYWRKNIVPLLKK